MIPALIHQRPFTHSVNTYFLTFSAVGGLLNSLILSRVHSSTTTKALGQSIYQQLKKQAICVLYDVFVHLH